MTTALVELRDVRKSYFSNRIETPVLHGINLAMQRGEFVAIMGQSGSGKSNADERAWLPRHTDFGQLLAGWKTLAASPVPRWPDCATAPSALSFRVSTCSSACRSLTTWRCR